MSQTWGIIPTSFFIHEEAMNPKVSEVSLEPQPRWISRIRDHSYHNKLTKKVRESLIRFHEEGVIDTTMDCALMKAPDSFVVSYMELVSKLDMGAHDLDNGHHILTNVSPEKLSVILEDRYKRNSSYVFGWSGKDELSKLGYLSFFSLPLDELIQFTDMLSENRSKIKYSMSAAFDMSGKKYKISVKASDNFYKPEKPEEFQKIEDIFDKAVNRVRREVPDVSVGNSWGVKNSKFDMYVDEIPTGLLNYLKIAGLPSYSIYLNKARYDMFTLEGPRQLMSDAQALIKYN